VLLSEREADGLQALCWANRFTQTHVQPQYQYQSSFTQEAIQQHQQRQQREQDQEQLDAASGATLQQELQAGHGVPDFKGCDIACSALAGHSQPGPLLLQLCYAWHALEEEEEEEEGKEEVENGYGQASRPLPRLASVLHFGDGKAGKEWYARVGEHIAGQQWAQLGRKAPGAEGEEAMARQGRDGASAGGQQALWQQSVGWQRGDLGGAQRQPPRLRLRLELQDLGGQGGEALGPSLGEALEGGGEAGALQWYPARLQDFVQLRFFNGERLPCMHTLPCMNAYRACMPAMHACLTMHERLPCMHALPSMSTCHACVPCCA